MSHKKIFGQPQFGKCLSYIYILYHFLLSTNVFNYIHIISSGIIKFAGKISG